MSRLSPGKLSARVFLYIDVRQCKGAGDLAQEGGLLVIGLDQSEGDGRSPELDGKGRGTRRRRPMSARLMRSLVARRALVNVPSGA